MGYITLRQIPPAIEKRLRAMAGARGASLNTTIISVLARALGVPEGDEKARDLSDLAGTWSEQEAAEFDENVRAFEQIDEDLWRTQHA